MSYASSANNWKPSDILDIWTDIYDEEYMNQFQPNPTQESLGSNRNTKISKISSHETSLKWS